MKNGIQTLNFEWTLRRKTTCEPQNFFLQFGIPFQGRHFLGPRETLDLAPEDLLPVVIVEVKGNLLFLGGETSDLGGGGTTRRQACLIN